MGIFDWLNQVFGVTWKTFAFHTVKSRTHFLQDLFILFKFTSYDRLGPGCLGDINDVELLLFESYLLDFL